MASERWLIDKDEWTPPLHASSRRRGAVVRRSTTPSAANAERFLAERGLRATTVRVTGSC